ncbi:hypothetical protein OIDMADRAFT_51023 [Oidiodendron maius Zn]|uniref:Uncharacterized protein n=1 Tax=Oidiodendron maius (strain Zn) TaxID=913774 RepID=A0A0C3D1U5_OIDMZ|nr:hypothetical protein OIDMADRAFT_51023 [Oidiodendron maius Zn]
MLKKGVLGYAVMVTVLAERGPQIFVRRQWEVPGWWHSSTPMNTIVDWPAPFRLYSCSSREPGDVMIEVIVRPYDGVLVEAADVDPCCCLGREDTVVTVVTLMREANLAA